MRLLIGYDGSACAGAALDDLHLAGLPRTLSALVLSVADVFLPPHSAVTERQDPEWLVAAVNRAHKRAIQAVEEARVLASKAGKRIQSDHPGWEVHAVACGDSPAWGIIEKAREWRADLVVVGAHGHSGSDRLVLGSVSQRVVGDAPCSVRVARSPKHQKDSPVRIIVAIDGSRDSEIALLEVAARAWPGGSAIRIVTVVDHMLSASAFESVMTGPSKTGDVDPGAWAIRMNDAAAEKLRVAGLAVSSLVTEGNAKDILVKEAKRWDADCVFVGAKGLRGIKRFLLGSVSAAVAARAPCSVEVRRWK